jgi:putative ABC transport system permease protein
MNAWRIVFARLRQRPLQTLLSMLLLGLGVATLVFVLLVHGQLSRQLARDARGVDLVVGAKGSPLQLILSAIYHVDVPTGNVPFATLQTLRAQRLVRSAIPLSLGDSYRGFRIVGTETDLLALYGARIERGAAWRQTMEVVAGSVAARDAGLAVGSRFHGTHGLVAGGPVHEDVEYTVVGVLAPTGTVADRLLLTGLDSVWFVHEGTPADEVERRILAEEREITAVLVTYASPLAAASLPRQVNAESRLMAAVPANELARLFAVVGVGIETMRAFAIVLVAAAALALFVALMNALEERRYDIAVMRLLGASRGQVAWLLLAEAWVLGVAALAVGFLLGLAAVAAVGGWLAQARSFTVSALGLDAGLLWVALLALGVTTLAAALPAWRASRMDVHQTLAQGQ